MPVAETPCLAVHACRLKEIRGCYHVVVRYGYTDVVDHGESFMHNLVAVLVQHCLESRRSPGSYINVTAAATVGLIDRVSSGKERVGQMDNKTDALNKSGAIAAVSVSSDISRPSRTARLVRISSTDDGHAPDNPAYMTATKDAAQPAGAFNTSAAPAVPTPTVNDPIAATESHRVPVDSTMLAGARPATPGGAMYFTPRDHEETTDSDLIKAGPVITGEQASVMAGTTSGGNEGVSAGGELVPVGPERSAGSTTNLWSCPGVEVPTSTDIIAADIAQGDRMKILLANLGAASDAAAVVNAYRKRWVHFLGRVNIKVRAQGPLWDQLMVGTFYRFMADNSRQVTKAWNIPTSNLIELGIDVEV